MSDTKVSLDEEQLRSLQEIDEDDPESNLLADLIDLFVAHSPDTLKSIAEAINKQDRNHLQKMAHKLKGSSANLGVESVRTCCAELEASSADLSWDEAFSEYKKIEESYKLSVEVLNRDWRKKA